MLLEKRKLGRTNLAVTAIAFGGLPMQRCTIEEAAPVLEAALDAGINFIDTARAYTDSEEKIGRHLSSRRKEYYLGTKSMARDKAQMAKDIDLSLKTMKTDYIDLYQVHNIKNREDLERVMAPGGALEALEQAIAAGKIGFAGVTGHSIEMLIEAVKTEKFSTVQVPFNFIETQAREVLFPLAKRLNVGTIIMKPLGGGQFNNPDVALRFILEHDISTVIPGMDECGYCLPCPAGLDIPTLFIIHLQYTRYNMKTASPLRYQAMPVKASACMACGQCEKRCPYDLPIRERLEQIAADMG
ncbi:MAG: yhdN 5 [Firmicutes bacterium]|nr:yhdN 5 [Bacillota bacterium]